MQKSKINQEVWKPIGGYKGIYEISNKGKVKSLNFNKISGRKGHKTPLNPKILKPFKNPKGYLLVNLHKNGKGKTIQVHRLVGIHFIINPNNKPQINHIDYNKTNNCINNLEWVTNLENRIHSAKLTKKQVLKIRKLKGKFSQRQLARKYNVVKSTIYKIHHNNIWKHI